MFTPICHEHPLPCVPRGTMPSLAVRAFGALVALTMASTPTLSDGPSDAPSAAALRLDCWVSSYIEATAVRDYQLTYPWAHDEEWDFSENAGPAGVGSGSVVAVRAVGVDPDGHMSDIYLAATASGTTGEVGQALEITNAIDADYLTSGRAYCTLLRGQVSGSVTMTGTLSGLSSLPMGSKLVVSVEDPDEVAFNGWHFVLYDEFPRNPYTLSDYYVDFRQPSVRAPGNIVSGGFGDQANLIFQLDDELIVWDENHDTSGTIRSSVTVKVSVVQDALHWTGAGGIPGETPRAYEDPRNWDKEMSPCYGDDVVFSREGEHTIGFSRDQTDATVEVSDGTVTFELFGNRYEVLDKAKIGNGASLTMTWGEMLVSGDLEVAGQLGVATQLSVEGETTVPTNGRLDISVGPFTTRGNTVITGNVTLAEVASWEARGIQIESDGTLAIEGQLSQQQTFPPHSLTVGGTFTTSQWSQCSLGTVRVLIDGTADVQGSLTCAGDIEVDGVFHLGSESSGYSLCRSLTVGPQGTATIAVGLGCSEGLASVSGVLTIDPEGSLNAYQGLVVNASGRVYVNGAAFSGEALVSGSLNLGLGSRFDALGFGTAPDMTVTTNGRVYVGGELRCHYACDVAGSLEIPAMGLVTAGSLLVGPGAHVDVAGSLMTVGSSERASLEVWGTLDIAPGGSVTASDMRIAQGAAVTVDGRLEAWSGMTVEGQLDIDATGSVSIVGTLNVASGVFLRARHGRITAGELRIGGTGWAELHITDDGWVTCGDAHVGGGGAEASGLTVAGSNSRWDVLGALAIGVDGPAEVRIDGAPASVGGSVTVGPEGALLVSNGGSLNTSGVWLSGQNSVAAVSDAGTAWHNATDMHVEGRLNLPGGLLTTNELVLADKGTMLVEDATVIVGDGAGILENNGQLALTAESHVTVNGQYKQSSSGSLAASIHRDPLLHGLFCPQVTINGQAELGGNLELKFLDGCSLRRSDGPVRVLQAAPGGSIAGQFDHVVLVDQADQALHRSVVLLYGHDAVGVKSLSKYKQGYGDWGSHILNDLDANTMSKKGCTMTALAMAASALLSENVTPQEVLDAYNNDKDEAHAYQSTTSAGIYPEKFTWKGTNLDGVPVEVRVTQDSAGNRKFSDIVSELRAGRPVMLQVPNKALDTHYSN